MKIIYVHPYVDQNAKGFWVDWVTKVDNRQICRQRCWPTRIEALNMIDRLKEIQKVKNA